MRILRWDDAPGGSERTPADVRERESEVLAHFGLKKAGAESPRDDRGEGHPDISAFYDPETRAVTLLGPWKEDLTDAPGIVGHELAHALLNQHFGDLWEAHLAAGGRLDVGRAILSVLEGHAEWVRESAGLKVPEPAPGPPVEQGSPFQGDDRKFPYEAGSAFVSEIFRRTGRDPEKLHGLFRRPPLSSEQILHPEKYLAEGEDWPTDIRMEKPGVEAEAGEVTSGMFGEMGLRHLVGERAAGGWDGDRYAIFRGKDGSTHSVWFTTWDSEEDAREFLEAYADRLAAKYSDPVYVGTGRWGGRTALSGNRSPAGTFPAGEERNRRIVKAGGRNALVERRGKDVLVLDRVSDEALGQADRLFSTVRKRELRDVEQLEGRVEQRPGADPVPAGGTGGLIDQIEDAWDSRDSRDSRVSGRR